MQRRESNAASQIQFAQPGNTGPSNGNAFVLDRRSPLVNARGMALTSLRISLTDRCNEQCLYCRPAGSRAKSPIAREGELTKEEILGIAESLVPVGVTTIRLTGGEPLIRPDLEEIVSGLSNLVPRPHLRLTTNGLGLARRARSLASAGLDRVNVSLDSVSARTYAAITGRDGLGSVIEGIEEARRCGLTPLRTNTVVCAGINDQELGDICRKVWQLGATPRFIELMPMGPLGRDSSRLLSAGSILARIEETVGPLSPLGPDAQGGPSLYFETQEGQRLGIIASVTGHICERCNRGRITARGGLQTCLAGPVEADLRAAWHQGGQKAVLAEATKAAAAKRPRIQWPKNAAMVDIGG